MDLRTLTPIDDPTCACGTGLSSERGRTIAARYSLCPSPLWQVPLAPVECPIRTVSATLTMGLPGVSVSCAEPLPGDHLVVHRGAYTHHGIYLGGDRIAHKVAGTGALGVAISSADASLRGESARLGGVALTDLLGFCPEARNSEDWTRVQVVHYAACFHPDDTVALALGAAGASSGAPYRLLAANCEHFSTWCKTGEHTSLQVLALRGGLSRFGALAAGLLAGVAVLARLEVAERTTTHTTHHKGGLLGLKRRRVVVTETSVEAQRVFLGASLVGAASAAAFGAVSRLQSSLFAARRYRLAVRLCTADGSAAGCHATDVLVLRSHVVQSGLEALRKHLVDAMGGAPGCELRCWCQSHGEFVELTSDEDVRQLLPRCTSLMLRLAV